MPSVSFKLSAGHKGKLMRTGGESQVDLDSLCGKSLDLMEADFSNDTDIE